MTKKMKQTVSLFFIALLITSLVGCGKNSDKERTATYHLTEVEKLEVKTNANDVILRTTESNDLTITFKGGDGELASLENGLLTVDLHKTFAGVAIKKLETLYIDIPKDGLSEVSIQSDAGNITINGLNVMDLSVNTEVGDITTIGLTGNVNAISGVGSIETDLSIASEIMAGKDGLGNTLKGNLNEEDKKSFTTELYTNTGKITLK
jgi:DUF4097 and DUF4098 domain-containing protein YvlB